MITQGRFRSAFRELMKEVGTAIPGHVTGFDNSTQLAQVQIGIKITDQDGNTHDPAVIIQCPVQFSGGGGWAIEHKIESGDEGIIIFSQRCIDAWIQTGGIASNPIARFHDTNDAMFIPGIRSKKNAISDFSNDGVKIRNKDGEVYLHLSDDKIIDMQNGAGNITMAGTGDININGVIIDTTGSIVSPASISGVNLSATTSLIVNQQEMSYHTHTPGTYTVNGEAVTGVSGASE